jgi:hypothetical protein
MRDVKDELGYGGMIFFLCSFAICDWKYIRFASCLFLHGLRRFIFLYLLQVRFFYLAQGIRAMLYIYIHIRSGVFLSGGFPWNADGRGLIRLAKEGVQAREGKERKKTVVDMLVVIGRPFGKGGIYP